ncbi:hypothetical protein [Actinomyces ruminis]|uniref:Uncharacterized protein n=1 Tax=Actinomyces ruminis TaxID=1937003 RepID=A0ABX4MBU1_9ACTO|nr:hypothetical protein [Actinomyces ruminis]PHP52960.1 hypothetical protein BW737_006110 [Actinomyces ruminis]
MDVRTRTAACAPRVSVANSRLRVGGLTAAGDAITLTQCDATTCGATTILAARLLLGLPLDKEISLPDAEAARPGRALQKVLAARQRALQRAMNRHARGPLGPLPWTRHLGSTPWAVAAELTRALRQVRPDVGESAVTWVGDGGVGWDDVVAELRTRLADGVPAILLTGGPLLGRADASGRVQRALHTALSVPIPRHYTLAVPWPLIGRADPGPGHIHLYEPASGTVRALDLLAPRARSGPGPRELGGWPRVLAVIAPPLALTEEN